MDRETMPRRLAAILCADVQGYSRLMGADEEGTLARLKCLRSEVLDPAIAEFRGRIFKTTGDGVLAEFLSVVDAVQCAARVQAAMAERAAADAEVARMVLRVGINLGDVIVDGDDLYGDGINVAARIEGLADGGGICISGSAYEQVAGKLKLAFEDLGEKSVKNIARPVRVYRVCGEGQAAGGERPRQTPVAASEKPAIAVLPFNNMSGDPEQEYFSDGITEDIITDLSKLSGLLVIARNSTFTCKGTAVDVREVGKRFCVSHVLEGSVRRAGGRVRITAQLLEASTGHHVWAERYDRDLQDIFAVQDEITREIVTALDVKLLRGEQASAWRKSLCNPEAQDAYYKGINLLNRLTREANAEAEGCFDEVTRVACDSPLGHLGLAWVHLSTWRYGWGKGNELETAAGLARKALELDESCADAHGLLGYYNLLAGNHDAAIAEGERSVALGPNHADNAANLACSCAVGDQPGEAVTLLRKAMRLSPVYPTWYLNILGFAHYRLGQYEAAAEAVNLGLQREPAFADCRLILAAAHHALGRTEEARRDAAETLHQDPTFKLASFENRLSIVKDREFVARFIGLMRELGLG